MFHKNILKVILVIIGTVMGAGFASGKEIFVFFNVYGIKGHIGIVIAMIIMGLVINKTLKLVYKMKICNYEEMNNYLIKDKKILKYVVMNIINIFLLISFYIMIAGFGTYFFQEFHISAIIGMSIIAILSYIIFIKNVDGLLRVNSFLVPILIVATISIGIKILKLETLKSLYPIHIIKESGNWLINSIFYASYNSIILVPILISLRKYVHSKKEINKISIYTSIIMVIISSIIYCVLENQVDEIYNIEIPMIYIVNQLGTIYKNIYGVVILAAIFTSAIAAGYGFLANLARTKKTYNILGMLMCSSAIIVGNIGFSNLVNLLYPIFGALGLIQIFFLFIKKT